LYVLLNALKSGGRWSALAAVPSECSQPGASGSFDATRPIAPLDPNRFAQSSANFVAGQIQLDTQRFSTTARPAPTGNQLPKAVRQTAAQRPTGAALPGFFQLGRAHRSAIRSLALASADLQTATVGDFRLAGKRNVRGARTASNPIAAPAALDKEPAGDRQEHRGSELVGRGIDRSIVRAAAR